ncbi:phosphotransferase family protein [Rossellomorea aquimaris]|uniref:Aminoglycoside phosphotransferase (APT) family kinase protein n=1 Tax=Rossellomorea aquimaris TaxID=189382 RepID=A0A366F2U7_9BACI|nr:phosphotransferase family protein [Rossellomorea aquimaris]RBP08025.1 aminoglycoside phosphotransferase (APT) family kinase protein [Rossellomorea aquimaris]
MSEKTGYETVSVREGEELNTTNLKNFLNEHFPRLLHEELSIKQFSAGHSNLTYLLKMGEWEGVLRRPPLGPVAPKAHDMKREYRILAEIQPVFGVTPEPYVFSDDERIVGSPFFIMERKRGEVFDTSFPPHLHVTPDVCREISEEMVSKLVELHSIDYRKTTLHEISKPEHFMERQVHGWIKRYERAKTSEIREVDQLTQWLIKNVPGNAVSTIIHYDFKLNNAMFSSDLKSMVGLFDWEMATVGDPLADLGVAMGYWIQNDDPELLKFGLGKPPVTIMDGFYTRRQFIEEYARKSGRDVNHIHFYLSFAYFKLAVIVQQIYYRFKMGQTRDSRFSQFDRFAESLITLGNQAAFDRQE